MVSMDLNTVFILLQLCECLNHTHACSHSLLHVLRTNSLILHQYIEWGLDQDLTFGYAYVIYISEFKFNRITMKVCNVVKTVRLKCRLIILKCFRNLFINNTKNILILKFRQHCEPSTHRNATSVDTISLRSINPHIKLIVYNHNEHESK